MEEKGDGVRVIPSVITASNGVSTSTTASDDGSGTVVNSNASPSESSISTQPGSSVSSVSSASSASSEEEGEENQREDGEENQREEGEENQKEENEDQQEEDNTLQSFSH